MEQAGGSARKQAIQASLWRLSLARCAAAGGLVRGPAPLCPVAIAVGSLNPNPARARVTLPAISLAAGVFEAVVGHEPLGRSPIAPQPHTAQRAQLIGDLEIDLRRVLIQAVAFNFDEGRRVIHLEENRRRHRLHG